MELARELFGASSGCLALTRIAFLDNWQVAKSAVGTNTFRETSHSSGFLQRHPLQERRRHSGALHHARGLDFVPECEGPGRRDCQGLQVALGPVRAGEMPHVPPTPFNDDAWHSARREAILRRLLLRVAASGCPVPLQAALSASRGRPPLSGNGLQLSHRQDASRSAR